MTYFVTGATGFIGRHLVEELLAKREGQIYVLVREGSTEKLDALIERWGPAAKDRVVAVTGDLTEPKLGVSDDIVAKLTGNIDHFFHLAAIYDITAPDEVNEKLNVGGTQNTVDLANAINAGTFHHVSSVAAAGRYKGLFREDMFDEGQKLDHPYYRTKFESEKIAREQVAGPWRVYRPAIVVGHSQTGEMDKIDGPYYLFKLLQRLRGMFPQWFPLVGVNFGWTNIVPVDFVAAALDHIAHQPDLDGQAFHLTHPKGQKTSDVLNTFARAGHAPQFGISVDRKLLDALPKGTLSMVMQLPALKKVRNSILDEWGIPEGVLENAALTCRFDTRDTERALAGSGIAVPELDTYAEKLWDYWERNLDPDLFKDRSFEHAVNGKTVLITGASSGIGKAAAIKIAAAGGIPLLVARTQEKLEETKAEIEAAGGTAYLYTADLADMESLDAMLGKVFSEHPGVDVLVNNAGRSIRRSIKLSYDRFHDFERTMQLNYFGAIRLILGVMPHMTERKTGHVINVSSIGVQTNPPRFAAYVASKSALDAFTRIAGTEVIGDGVHFTTIHMPLVRTPMIAPTKMYDSFPTITPDEAADMICEAIRSKPKGINTRLGTFGEVAYALAPKAVDQILHMAYKVFPDSAAAKGQKDEGEHASVEQIAVANIMKGVHW
jgi:NAD(P)-dependent dehydrogenase (short-subunit alcohol dehydrogenase family)